MGAFKPLIVNQGSPKQRRWIFALLSCLGVVAILVVSFLPTAEKNSLHTRGRLHSPAHLAAFGLVAFLVGKSVWSARVRMLLVAVIVLLGFWVELGEHLAFGAAFEWKDVLLDVLGIIGGTLLALTMGADEA